MRREKNIIFLFFLFCFRLHLAMALEPTTKTEMPVPFAYLENLYFKYPLHFIAYGNTFDPDTVIRPYIGRPYRFIQVVPGQKRFPPRLGILHNVKPLHFDGTTVLLFEYPTNYSFHFFHLLEHIVGVWAFYGCEHAHEIKRIVLAGDGIDKRQNWEGPNQINQHLLKALFPQAEIMTLDGFIKECSFHFVCLERAVISDRAISYLHPQCQHINKLLGAALPYMDSKHLQSFADAVHSYAQTKSVAPSDQLRITYIKRTPPRCLAENIERRLLEAISSLPNVQLKVEDFAQISFHEQVRIIGNTDVLISVHGNGLSHLLLLPKDSCVIEIFPPEAHHFDYRLFADARGIDYFGILYKADDFLEKNRAYEIGAYGSTSNGIEELNIDLVLSAIRSRMQKNH